MIWKPNIAIPRTAFQRALPILASFYSKSFKVRVIVRGKEAYTDGTTICIPAITGDDDYMSVSIGYLAHECGHVAYTDFSVYNALENEPRLLELVNILEDVRIESLLFDSFPLTSEDISNILGHLIADGELCFKPKYTHWALVHAFILCYMRVNFLSQHVIDPVLEQYTEALKKFNFKLYEELVDLLKDESHSLCDFNQCKNTSDVVDLARKILGIIDQYIDFNVGKNQPKDPTGANNQPGGIPNSDLVPQPKRKRGRPPKKKELTEEELKKLKVPDYDLLPDIFSSVRNQINEKAKDSLEIPIPSDIEVEEVDQNLSYYKSPEMDEVYQNANYQLDTLERAMSSIITTKGAPTSVGSRINLRHLYSLASSGTKLFDGGHLEGIGVDTTFHILCDISGSMGRIIPNTNPVQRWFELSNAATFAISLALSQISGVKQEVSYFPGQNGDVVKILTEDDDPLECMNNFKQVPRGTTPLDVALWYAFQRIEGNEHNRNIILVITDGLPNDQEKVKYVLDELEAVGAEVYAISVGERRINYLFKKCTFIPSVIDLHDELFELVANLLLDNIAYE